MDYVEKKAGRVEKAIELALSELGIRRDEAEIEILSEGKLLSKAVVRVSKRGVEVNAEPEIDEALVSDVAKSGSRENVTEGATRAFEFVDGLVKAMGLNAEAKLTVTEEEINVTVSGKDSSVLIGYRGEVLDAVQYLTLLAVNKGESGFARVVVDSENYRAKRTEVLSALAERLAEKADRLGRRIELEPMNPFERRIIHAALSENDKAHTESKGVDPNRYVVIIPENETPGAEPERFGEKKSGRKNDRKGRGDRKRSSRGGKKQGFSDNYRPTSSGYDPYAPSEEYAEKAPRNFSKQGPGKLRSFGYKKR